MIRTQHAVVAAGALLLTALSFCGDAQSSPAAKATSVFTLKYVQSGQDSSQIAISGLRLRRSSAQCQDASAARNCSSPTTQSAEVTLKSDDVRKLQATIETSGFLRLKDVYGNSAQGAQSYPKSITIRTGNITKSVEYRGGPGVEPAPAAFIVVERAVVELASKAKLPAS